MYNGLIKVAAVTPSLVLGDCAHNAKQIAKSIARLSGEGAEIIAFPELCVCGYTLGEKFLLCSLKTEVEKAVRYIAQSVPDGVLVFVGAPVWNNVNLYNCAIAMQGGEILAIVPKTHLPNYGEFYEKRYFSTTDEMLVSETYNVPFGTKQLFAAREVTVGVEICEDLWVPVPPSSLCALNGANIIVNLSASDEVTGKAEFRRTLTKSQSARLVCAYIYADAGSYESATDMTFSAHNIVAENGAVLAESAPFTSGLAVTEIDVDRLNHDRQKQQIATSDSYQKVAITFNEKKITPVRKVERRPFVDGCTDERLELILSIQSTALERRFKKVGAKKLVLGLSGGLDSALALLVCNRVNAAKTLAVTMPAFGTSDRTLNNARNLCRALNVELKTVPISDTVTSHLKDINHTDKKDVTYENAQARMRTVTIFDIANAVDGIVVGTGDMSEAALGWCTYGGDHLSSYGVNAGVPKTLVKTLVDYEARRLKGECEKALNDILNTEISPELLPPVSGQIAQKTEDILGSYDLHDFFLYYFVRFGMSKEKILYLASLAFSDIAKEKIAATLDLFFDRFYKNQFKRSCTPDAPKIGSVALSPRADWRFPSD